MKIGLSLPHADRLVKTLREAGAALRDAVVVEALKAAADPMRADMASRMARSADAPHAADHVIIARVNEIDGEKVGPMEFAIGIGPIKEFYYWYFQEYGTVHHPPQPAMRPAFDAGVEGALKSIGHHLWDAIARHVGERSTSGGLA